ncbi:MAG: hypothetical protein P4L40_01905 [Terracidiphilus sp.]|nr:hypothetical protein [Terracidiphilus sp.]
MVDAPEACDSPTLVACGQTLSTCVEQNAANPSYVCACRGAYDTCLSNAGCPQDTINAVVASCEETGCTPAQVCRWVVCLCV